MEAFTDTLPMCAMSLCITDTLPIVRNGDMYESIYRHFTKQVRNGFMYGSIYRHFTNSV